MISHDCVKLYKHSYIAVVFMKKVVLFFLALTMVVANISAQSAYKRAYKKAKMAASKPQGDIIKEESVEFIVGDPLQRYGIVCSIYSNVKDVEKDCYNVSKYASKAAVVKRKNGDYMAIAMNSDNLDDVRKLKEELPSKYRKDSWIIEFEELVTNTNRTFTVSPSNTSPKQDQPSHINVVEKTTRSAIIDDVDWDIPLLPNKNDNTFAIIIANEDYQKESKVDFAINDGSIFRKYCQNLLGIPEKNIHYVQNGTLNNIIYELDWIEQVCKVYAGNASVILYYAGHGVPDESNGSAYLLPIDGFGRNLRTCISLDELYKSLSMLSAKKVLVFLDACFSGAKRDGDMITSVRGVAIKAKTGVVKGNLIVMAASQSDETAYYYKDAHHGLFTYYLLKKLQETDGSVTLGELSSYLKQQVSKKSIVENGKLQTPIIITSQELKNNWEKMKLR